MEYHDITAEIWRSMLDVSPSTTAESVTGFHVEVFSQTV